MITTTTRTEGRIGSLVCDSLLLLLIIFHVGLTIYWIRADQMPPFWDEAWYLYHGAVQADALRNEGLPGWYRVWLSLDPNRPPLAQTLTMPFFLLLGRHEDSGVYLNTVSLPILLGCTYLLGTSLGGRRTGLLAALLLGGYPLVIGLSHTFLVELTKLALISVTLLGLWKCDGFRRTGWSVLTAVAIAAGGLTKILFPLYIAGPWCVAVAAALLQRPEDAGTRGSIRLRNAVMTVALPLVVGATWYLPNLRMMWDRSVSAAIGSEASLYGPEHPWSFDSLLAYTLEFVGQDLSFFAMLAFLAGLAGLAFALRRNRASGDSSQPMLTAVLFLATSVVPTYVLLTSLRNQDHNHVSGLLPALAVLTAFGLTHLAGAAWPALLAVILPYSFYQTVAGSDPEIFARLHMNPPPILYHGRLVFFYVAQSPLVNPRYAYPERASWPTGEIVESIGDLCRERAQAGGDPCRVGVVPNYPGIEESALQLAGYLRGLPLQVEFADPSRICEYDILVHKTGDPGFPNRLDAVAAIEADLRSDDSCFRRADRVYPLPDDGDAIVYVAKVIADPSPPSVPSAGQPIPVVGAEKTP